MPPANIGQVLQGKQLSHYLFVQNMGTMLLISVKLNEKLTQSVVVHVSNLDIHKEVTQTDNPTMQI